LYRRCFDFGEYGDVNPLEEEEEGRRRSTINRLLMRMMAEDEARKYLHWPMAVGRRHRLTNGMGRLMGSLEVIFSGSIGL